MAEILIIADDQQMRRLMSRILDGAGHNVHEAMNGREGLNLFRKLRPMLVITDLVMPDMEGIETIRELHLEAPTVPIIAVSGGSGPNYLHAATEFGATASLEKPFTPDALLESVKRLLDTAGKQGQ
jgi:DNA-binding NtrC family response regulator